MGAIDYGPKNPHSQTDKGAKKQDPPGFACVGPGLSAKTHGQ